MTKYIIENTVSGVILGTYEAESAEAALDAMARDAGYSDYAHCCAEVPASDGEIIVSIADVTPPPTDDDGPYLGPSVEAVTADDVSNLLNARKA